jgi:hypothetical protein
LVITSHSSQTPFDCALGDGSEFEVREESRRTQESENIKYQASSIKYQVSSIKHPLRINGGKGCSVRWMINFAIKRVPVYNE